MTRKQGEQLDTFKAIMESNEELHAAFDLDTECEAYWFNGKLRMPKNGGGYIEVSFHNEPGSTYIPA